MMSLSPMTRIEHTAGQRARVTALSWGWQRLQGKSSRLTRSLQETGEARGVRQSLLTQVLCRLHQGCWHGGQYALNPPR